MSTGRTIKSAADLWIVTAENGRVEEVFMSEQNAREYRAEVEAIMPRTYEAYRALARKHGTLFRD